MRPVRLALVGYGRWGRNYIRAAHDSGVARVTHAVLRPDSPSRPPAVGAGLIVTDKLDDLEGVDAAVVAVHPGAAPWVCSALLSYGLPVMVEKPASLDIAGAEALADAARASGLTVLVGHQHLFSAQIELMRSRGTPDSVVATFGGPVARDYPARWDYGPHAVSAVIALAPKIPAWSVVSGHRIARVDAHFGNDHMVYDGYAPAEPSLTRAVRAFADAVRAGGTDDYRFGAHWAVNVASVLESL